MSNALIHFTDLACRRGDRMLWRGVSGTLRAGEALYVVGANGIGKSSLIRILTGLLPASGGTLDRPARAAMIDEALALDRELTLARALSFWAQIDCTGDTAVRAALDQLAIPHLADVPVRFLSTGQRKRAALARVVAADAQLWLLDEPGNGLDRDGIAMLERLIAAHRGAGGAVLVASHLPLAIDGAQRLDLADHIPALADAWDGEA